MNPCGGKQIGCPFLRPILCLAVCLSLAVPARAQVSSNILVTTTAAGGPGSLADAINQANSNSGAHIITLLTNAVFGYTTPDNFWYGPNALPAIASDITIEGNGSVLIRTTTNRLRFFYVGADPNNPATSSYNSPGAGKVTLRHLTLTNGLALGGIGGGGGAGMGGAIFNQGILVLDSVTLVGNAAVGGKGGLSDGTYEEPGRCGGGMGEDGGNGISGRGGGFGGAVVPAGSVGSAGGTNGGGGGGFGVSDSGNGALGGGAANGLGGNASTGGVNSGNGSGYGPSHSPIDVSPNGGVGGAFGFGGTAGSEYPCFCNGGNYNADGGGGSGPSSQYPWLAGSGGFGGGGGTGAMSGGYGGGTGGFGGGGGASHDTKSIGGFGGGTSGCGSSDAGNGGGAGMGGGIFNHNGRIMMTNCTFALNQSQGGMGSGGGGCGFGGAIFNLNGSIVIFSSTIASNSVRAGAGAAGGSHGTNGLPGFADGGAFYSMVYDSAISRVGTVTLANSILAGTVGGNDVVNIFPATTTAGNNLGNIILVAGEPNIIQNFSNSGGVFTNTGVITNNPLLGPLANNGGPTPTMALLPGSPAIDAGDSSLAPATDQRGQPRVSGAVVDLGAVEYQMPLLITAFGFPTPGQFQIQFLGTAGGNYSILSSTNLSLPLTNWTYVGPAAPVSSNLFQFTDSSAPGNSSVQYYRVRQP